MNNAPIDWLSNKKATIETSVFGANFFAMKIGMETLWVLQYKLLMMEVPILGMLFIYGYKISFIHNIQRPEYTLKKSRIQFVTIQIRNMWQRRKVWRGMCHQWTTWKIFVQKFFWVEQSGRTLLIKCYMTYTSYNVLGTVPKCKYVDKTYGCISLRGMKTGYHARNSNKYLADAVTRSSADCVTEYECTS